VIMKKQPKALLFGAGLATTAMLLSPGRGFAQSAYTLADGGSSVTFNLGSGSGTLGMNSWNVSDGSGQMQNELDQQWFWYQIGSGPVQSIDQLGLQGTPQATSNDGGANDILTVTYGNSLLSINVIYTLAGSGMGSGTANIQQNITASGTGADANFNIFEYSNFNLLANNNNYLQVVPDGSGGYAFAQQTASQGSSSGISEGFSTPDPFNAEAGLANDNGANDVLNAVEAGNLNGNSMEDPNDDVTLTAGPGDVAWAFEWNSSQGSIQKINQLSVMGVPEPSTIALIGLGLGAIGLVRRRKVS
jgi:PEP-CTERM motif